MGRMFSKLTCALGLLLLVGMGRAEAGLITYEWSTIGTGSLGSSTFVDAVVTLTATADTDLVTNPEQDIFFNVPSVASVSVAGVGTGVFTGSIVVVGNQHFPAAGISDFGQNRGILFCVNDAFITYDLTTSLGPVTGVAANNPTVLFATTAGDFRLRIAEIATFTAVTAVVPEPSTFALAGSAIFGGFVAARRRRTKLVG